MCPANQAERDEERKFCSSTSITNVDSAGTELVLDRVKSPPWGRHMAAVGGCLSALLAGNFVNRFHSPGRRYKVIPQLKRTNA